MPAHFGIPTLIENPSLEQSLMLCSELELDFVELNMSLPEYQLGNIDIPSVNKMLAAFGKYLTIRLDKNLNVCDFNPSVSNAYLDTVMQTIELAKNINVPIINMCMNSGAYFALPDKKVYLFERYLEKYLDRLRFFRNACEKAICESNIIICIEKSDECHSFQQAGIDLLLESHCFALDCKEHCVLEMQAIEERRRKISESKSNKTNDEKVDLFLSLFRGRDDVYARRWESKDGQKSGYSPVCRNEWVRGICEKPRMKCGDCKRRELVPIDKQAIARHLTGTEVAGIYPLLPDETCLFLAIDFDDDGWQQDIAAVRLVCNRNKIPVAAERSRSGNGAHIWLFFDKPVSASIARKLGTAILTATMEEYHKLKFKSYDRLFPNQDTMPKGGFGNLIALPLQRKSRDKGNSVFVDDNFIPYSDQWTFLSGIRHLNLNETERYISLLCKGSELGNLHNSDEDENADSPWQKKTLPMNLNNADFPPTLRIVEANMLYIEKESISHKALNRIKRMAAFKNPEFYKAQAMRFPTWDKPRIISVSDETEKYIYLPRGCKEEIASMLENLNVSIMWQDERNAGKPIEVSFNGTLRDEQAVALENLLRYDNGILSATTAFGKTVVSAALIAARKTNTLVLVNRQPLLDQWKTRLTDFLSVKDIGQFSGRKKAPKGIIDIAVMQSLVRGDEVKDIVKNYGMVIVDECHHVSAVSFERVLKEVNAKYVYGLTATPKRQDGHQPIIFMHCGQIRYKDDAKRQAQLRPFEHFVIPRFTSFRIPVEKDCDQMQIQDLYREICQSESRNNLIVDDVLKAVEDGRNSLVLTERKMHVELLENAIKEKVPNLITFVGDKTAKERKNLIEKIDSIPAGQPFVIVATGKYVGEGFDVPRLDTLFLAMPIAWQGTLAQYAGRLHRLYEGKREVRVYDYVDIRVAVLDRMYAKRVKGYATIGYKTKSDVTLPGIGNIIFDVTNFLQVFTTDLQLAKRDVVIVSPFLTRNRIAKMLKTLSETVSPGTKVTVVTHPADDYAEKDRARLALLIQMLKTYGITVVERSKIHQKFAVIDGYVVWYGSINLLSYGSAEESIMRLESKGIAGELLGISCFA